MNNNLPPPPSENTTWVMFGDGMFAFLGDVTPDAESKTYIFKLRPTISLRYKHNIQEDNDVDYDRNSNYYYKKYPAEYCKQLDRSPQFNTWILFCDWEGNRTDFLSGVNAELATRLAETIKENQILKKYISRLYYQLKQATTHPGSLQNAQLNYLKQVKDVVGTQSIIPGMSPQPPLEEEQ